MSTDDFYDDEDEEDVDGAPADGDDDGSPQAAQAKGLKDWLNSRRGWVLVIALAVAQGLFAIIMLVLKGEARPTQEVRAPSIQNLATEMLGYEVGIKDIYQSLPARGGKRVSIGMELVLVLGQLPEERIEGSEKPTAAEFAVFVAVIQEMEPHIRSRLNTLIQRLPTDELNDPDTRKMIKEDIGDYVNDMLEGLDFGKSVRKGIGKRRVTDVLIPMFLLQGG